MQQQKKWILMTGVSRGIGRSLSENLRKRGFFVCGLLRPVHLQSSHLELDECLPWDLDLSWDSNQSELLLEFMTHHSVIGFIHGAGVLGPMNPIPQAASEVHWQNWWREYHSTMRVNHTAGLELVFAVKSLLKSWTLQERDRQPFVMHLSSGAAVKPYAGWDAYCASKASMLMAFKALAAKVSAQELNVLSVAPGTVMTDMMQKVLAAKPEDFPALPKFKLLEQTGGLVTPDESASQICHWLVESLSEELAKWHGQLYDVRDNNSVMK